MGKAWLSGSWLPNKYLAVCASIVRLAHIDSLSSFANVIFDMFVHIKRIYRNVLL